MYIAGNVTGNTKIAIGGTNNTGTNSSTVPKKDHAYITAQQSQNGAFTLLPYAAQTSMTLEKDDAGNWKVPEGGTVQEVKVQTAKMNPTHQMDRWGNGSDIPIKVVYSNPNTMPSMAKVPVEIKINDKPASKANGTDGYVYTSSTNNLNLEFTVVDDESNLGQWVDVLSCSPATGYSFYEGQYKIDITIPREYTKDGTPIALTTMLNITKDEVQPPQPPQVEDIDLQKAKITVAQVSFVYNKGEHRPAVIVMVDGKQLKPEQYTVDYTNNTNAGQATITVTAVKGSGYTGSASTHFTIDKAQLALKTANVAAKTYDGTKDAVVTDVTFHDQNDAPIVLEANKDYTIQAQFNDANVAAAKNVTVTADLSEQTKENYALNTNTLTVPATMTKDAIAPVEGNMVVTNHHKSNYTYDLMQLLTQLEGVKTYGNITFDVVGVNLDAYYTNGATISGNTLTLPIVSVDTQKEGVVGTITVGIQTDNYTVQHATIHVNAVNKLALQGAPKLSGTTLTYGDALSKITLSGSMQDDSGKTVEGIFEWVNPQDKPAAGNTSAQWKFTPNDTNAYQVAMGQVTLTVQKVTPKGEPKYTSITTSGKTLADAEITAAGNTFGVAGTVKWVLPDTTEVKVNTTYDWIFTPDDTNNYNVVKGSIIPYVVSGALEVKGVPTLSSTTLTYGDALSKITLSGSIQDDSGKTVEGIFEWVHPQDKPAAGNISAQWKFTPNDTNAYQVAIGQVTLTVQKATPTGKPKYTSITTSGKTLADAKITAEGSAFSTIGTVKWVLPDTTEVKANTAYDWIFTPDDANNYNIIKGNITPYVVSSSGGSSGGSNHNDNNKNHNNQTGTNKEGSTTTVEKKKDGTVITTTTKSDGFVSKVEKQKDGSTIETNTTANGTIGKIAEDADGKITEISGQVSNRDAQLAKEQGKAVQIPVKVPNVSSTEKATSITLDIPKDGAKVEIPVDNLTSGTVVVMVHQDGTEEVVKYSGLTKEGVTLALSQDATVKVVDRSQFFQDVQAEDWYKNAVNFMSARELMNGTNSMQFSPNQNLSRGMLATILYHLENHPTVTKQSIFTDVSENTWYADAIQWAAQAGVLSGYKDGKVKPNDNITREQFAVMLYRYAGSPTTTKQLNGFVDSKDTSKYAKTAIAWAVENGVMSGKGNGILEPKGLATRAEAAQMVMNFINQ